MRPRRAPTARPHPAAAAGPLPGPVGLDGRLRLDRPRPAPSVVMERRVAGQQAGSSAAARSAIGTPNPPRSVRGERELSTSAHTTPVRRFSSGPPLNPDHLALAELEQGSPVLGEQRLQVQARPRRTTRPGAFSPTVTRPAAAGHPTAGTGSSRTHGCPAGASGLQQRRIRLRVEPRGRVLRVEQRVAGLRAAPPSPTRTVIGSPPCTTWAQVSTSPGATQNPVPANAVALDRHHACGQQLQQRIDLRLTTGSVLALVPRSHSSVTVSEPVDSPSTINPARPGLDRELKGELDTDLGRRSLRHPAWTASVAPGQGRGDPVEIELAEAGLGSTAPVDLPGLHQRGRPLGRVTSTTRSPPCIPSARSTCLAVAVRNAARVYADAIAGRSQPP